jgi:hypothetical protein
VRFFAFRSFCFAMSRLFYFFLPQKSKTHSSSESHFMPSLSAANLIKMKNKSSSF